MFGKAKAKYARVRVQLSGSPTSNGPGSPGNRYDPATNGLFGPSALLSPSSLSPNNVQPFALSSPALAIDPQWKARQWELGLEEAKKELSAAEKDEVSVFMAGSLEAAMDATRKAHAEMEQKKWSYVWHGKTIFIAERLSRLLHSLEKYAKIGDICIQHNPEVTSLIWGSFRFLLQVAIEVVNTKESLFNTLGEIVGRVAKCEYYASLYGEFLAQGTGAPPATAAPPAAIAEQFAEALSGFYGAVVVFVVRAKRYYTPVNSVWKALKPFDIYFTPLLVKIDERDMRVRECAELATMSRIRVDSGRIQEIKAIVDDLPRHVQDVSQNLTQLLQDSQAQQMRVCRLWLDPEDASPEYERNQKAKMHGTCSWMVNDSRFQSWMNSAQNQLMWVMGKAGTGKSIISASVVEYFNPSHDYLAPNAQQLLLYFFFRNGNARTASTATMIASLIEQLFQRGFVTEHGRLFEILKQVYDKENSPHCKSVDNLWRMFSKMVTAYPARVFVILDALDECEDLFSTSLLTWLAASDSGARFLVTSRPERYIIDSLSPSQHMITLQMNAHNDIETFICSRVYNSQRLRGHGKLIIDRIRSTCDGMFRYAALMLEELERPSEGLAVDEVLAALPNGLSDMYERLILRLPAMHKKLCKTTFMFITLATRPVTPAEVAYACAVRDGEENFDPKQKILATEEDILKACGLFVEIFGTGTLRFSHLTVKDYFLGNPHILLKMDSKTYDSSTSSTFDPWIALQASMALSTVTQISGPALALGGLGYQDPVKYAATNWPSHAAKVASVDLKGEFSNLWTRVEILLGSEMFSRWQESQIGAQACTSRPLHVISRYGFTYILGNILPKATDPGMISSTTCTSPHSPGKGSGHPFPSLELHRQDVDINLTDDAGWTPLSLAAKHGHEAVLRLLLQWPGVEINREVANTQRRLGTGTPLSWAVEYGHDAVVNILLDQPEIDVNLGDSEFGYTPLLRAMKSYSKTLVKTLLERPELDVNRADYTRETPLSFAVQSCREELVKLLLERPEIDVNLANQGGKTPLSLIPGWPTAKGQRVMRLLLERPDVDVNYPDVTGRTPLSCLAETGPQELVELLLERTDLDINLSDDDRRTPLCWAACCGQKWFVDLLLGRPELDVNVPDHTGKTPLACAAASSHDSVAKLLLGHPDIQVNLADRNGQTPLSWATMKNCAAVVKLLLERPELDVNLADNNRRTPLSWAALKGHRVAIELLLQQPNLDVTCVDSDGRTPLLLSVEFGYEAVVRLLLRRKEVDVNGPDKSGMTPLSWTAITGYEAVAKLLLEHSDIKVNLPDRNGQTPLLLSTEFANEAVVQRLLERPELEVNCLDSQGQTPLSWAAKNSHEVVVKMLLGRPEVDVDIDWGDFDQSGLLVWAVERENEKLVIFLLEKTEVDINEADPSLGRTPLSWAAERGHEWLVKLLLERQEVDVNLPDKRGLTPLLWAMLMWQEGVVKLLLERQEVYFNLSVSGGWTPISMAARCGHAAAVERMLEHLRVYANLAEFEFQLEAPLFLAAEAGHAAVVKVLLGHSGVNINMTESRHMIRTPLIVAAKEGHEGVVKLLVERQEVDVNLADSVGLTALAWAAKGGHEMVAEVLLGHHGVNVNLADPRTGQTPITWAARGGHAGVVRMLLERQDVDVNIVDSKFGMTPLAWALMKRHEELAKLLLLRPKTDVNIARFEHKQTPILQAAELDGGEGMVEMLMARKGVQPDKADAKGWTPLLRAAKNGHAGVVRMLLAALPRVNVNSADLEHKRTPLIWAARLGHTTVVKLLLERPEININLADKSGRTPLSWATDQGQEEVVQMLLARGALEAHETGRDGQMF